MRVLCHRSLVTAVLPLMLVCVAGAQQTLKTTDSATNAPAVPSAHGKGKHSNSSSPPKTSDATAADAKTLGKNAYDYGLPAEDGKNLPLSTFKGKVLLIVNLARMSTYASQLSGLQKLNDTFKDKGLVILGVPSSDFGNAEPGTPAEIAKAYAEAKVTFPVMQVSTLTGVHELPLFEYLTKDKAIKDDGLHWNYTKFLVDRKGNVIVRFPPEVGPDSLEMIATVQEVVDGTWKPKKAPEKKEEEGGADDDDE